MKEYLKKYSIAYKGLAVGTHKFIFRIDNKFFTYFPESEIKEGNATIKILLEVDTKELVFKFLLEGDIKVQCDICLDEFFHHIKYKTKLIVDFAEESSDITDVDDKITLSYNENEINLAQHFYEFLNLSLPVKKIHPVAENGKSTCNQDMLKKLKEYSSIKTTHKKEIDSRWDKLKNLNIN
jgi:uncharacterized protein